METLEAEAVQENIEKTIAKSSFNMEVAFYVPAKRFQVPYARRNFAAF